MAEPFRRAPVILINRGGGSLGEGGGADEAAVAEALRDSGIAGKPEWVDGADLRERAEAAVAGGAELVIAGGGDGTISTVAGALAGTATALGVLPLGTFNHFARDLGISMDLKRAAALIAMGKRRRVDVAEVNGRIFVNNSAIGLYPLMVTDREEQQARLGRSKRAAMLVAAARTLFHFSSERLAVTVNDRDRSAETPLLFVGNNAYRMQLPNAGRRDSMDAGELFVLVLRSKSRLGFCVAAMRSLLGWSRAGDAVRLDHVDDLRVDSAKQTLTVSLDGETVELQPPLHYRIRKQALTVIAH